MGGSLQGFPLQEIRDSIDTVDIYGKRTCSTCRRITSTSYIHSALSNTWIRWIIPSCQGIARLSSLQGQQCWSLLRSRDGVNRKNLPSVDKALPEVERWTRCSSRCPESICRPRKMAGRVKNTGRHRLKPIVEGARSIYTWYFCGTASKCFCYNAIMCTTCPVPTTKCPNLCYKFVRQHTLWQHYPTVSNGIGT